MEEVLKYKDRLLQSDQDKAQKEVEFQVKQAMLQLDADFLATEQSLAENEELLNKLLSTYPFDVQAIINTKTVIAELQAGIEELKKLKKELF
jgi:hypothetical protein